MAWQKTVLNENGKSYSYDVYRQEQLNNCGPSCIMMLVKYALKKNVAIGFAQAVAGKAEITARKESNISGAQADARWHSWGEEAWTTGWTLREALKKKWSALKVFDNSADTIAQLKACTPAKPAICRVGWRKGSGGHFIICLGMKDSAFLFLDPYHGIVLSPNKVSNSQPKRLSYNTTNGSFGRGGDKAWVTYAIFSNPS